VMIILCNHGLLIAPASVIAKLSSELGIKPVEADKVVTCVLDAVCIVLLLVICGSCQLSEVSFV